MDYSKISNIEVENINFKDAPDFCDAYIASADYNGEPMNQAQIDELNEDSDFVYNCVINQIY